MGTINQWTKELQSDDPRLKAQAAEALAGLGTKAQPAIIALVQSIGAKDEDVRNWCTAALEEVGPPTLAQIADLAALANSANSDIAFWAVTLLGRAEQDAAEAVAILNDRLNDAAAPAVQQRAAWALERIQAA